MTEKVNKEVETQVPSPDAEKKTDPTVPEPAQEKKEPENPQEVVEPQVDIDYKAEYEKLSKEHEQAQHLLKEKRLDKKEKPEKEKKPDVDKIVEQKVAKEMQSLRDDTIEEVIDAVSDNEDERKLIRYHYENSVVPTGHSRSAIINDVRNAHAIANQKRIQKENSELKNTLKQKGNMLTPSLGANQDQPKVENEQPGQFSDADNNLLRRAAKNNPKKMEELKQRQKDGTTVRDLELQKIESEKQSRASLN